jgi:dethiobiotin synthetase
MNYFITAIHTDSGKTVAASILTHALQADYWKPVQCGLPRDTDTAAALVNNNHSLFFDEAYLLKTPASPHQAAKVDGIEIDLDKIHLPETSNDLVIEGAGGILVPLNKNDFVIDLAVKFEAQVILVANLYLGSINHTLLTAAELKRRNIPVKGIIFNGPDNPASKEIIKAKTGYRELLHIAPEKEINQAVITHYAIKLFETGEF